MRRREVAANMVSVIRDPRNARRDYLLPLARARELLVAGELDFDLTNGAYCHKVEDVNGKVKA